MLFKPFIVFLPKDFYVLVSVQSFKVFATELTKIFVLFKTLYNIPIAINNICKFFHKNLIFHLPIIFFISFPPLQQHMSMFLFVIIIYETS